MSEVLLKRCTIKDKEFVEKVLNDPKVRDYATDDRYSGPIDAGSFFDDDGIFVFKYGEYGIIIFKPFNFISYEVHFFLLSEHHSKFPYHYVWVKDGIEWMFKNTKCQKVIGFSIHFFENSERSLLLKEGKLTKAFMKKGKLFDLNIYGASKKDWEETQNG